MLVSPLNFECGEAISSSCIIVFGLFTSFGEQNI
jgi:hypothetical protein